MVSCSLCMTTLPLCYKPCAPFGYLFLFSSLTQVSRVTLGRGLTAFQYRICIIHFLCRVMTLCLNIIPSGWLWINGKFPRSAARNEGQPLVFFFFIGYYPSLSPLLTFCNKLEWFFIVMCPKMACSYKEQFMCLSLKYSCCQWVWLRDFGLDKKAAAAYRSAFHIQVFACWCLEAECLIGQNCAQFNHSYL